MAGVEANCGGYAGKIHNVARLAMFAAVHVSSTAAVLLASSAQSLSAVPLPGQQLAGGPVVQPVLLLLPALLAVCWLTSHCWSR